MPRQARIDTLGALHHIICRGIERKPIFRDNEDRENFLERLGKILVETSTSCFAWALIPNHFHLLLRTGATPIATVMRRLLTGYAVTFNHRHGRNGRLFQNRYKSILCEEEPYLLELVRYIHLNPVRAGLVADLAALDRYPYAGHRVLVGKAGLAWQDAQYILDRFGRSSARSRQRYRKFMQEGIRLGRRPELTGGGLIRSLGGWEEAKAAHRETGREKGDERILGGSGFVEEALRIAEESLSRHQQFKAAGYGLDALAREVAGLFAIEPRQIFSAVKSRQVSRARSVFCYWAARELGFTATALARELHLSQPAVSMAIQRGENLAKEEGYVLSVARKL